MPTQEKITRLQQQAQELVSNLDELCNQVESYRSAKDELQKASSELLGLAESTRQLSDESHHIIKAVNEIGSAKILERLNDLHQLTGTTKQSLEEGHKSIRTVNQDGNAKILERLNDLDQLTGSTKQSLEEGHKSIRTINQDGNAKILERLDRLSKQASKRQTIILVVFALVIISQIVFFILARN